MEPCTDTSAPCLPRTLDNVTIMADLGSLDPTVTEPLFKNQENSQKIMFDSMTDEYKTYM